jgi:hypothetical protein
MPRKVHLTDSPPLLLLRRNAFACFSDFNKGSEECGDGLCDDLRLKAEG